MQLTIAVVLACFVTCLLAVPIRKKRSTVVQFELPAGSDSGYPWHTVDPIKNLNSTMSWQPFGSDPDNLQCPTQVLEGDNLKENVRSSCPWWYDVDHVPTRYPATILKAKPVCIYAIGSNNSLKCEPIRRSIKTLVGTDVGNGLQFVEQDLSIEVGYTAVGMRTAGNGDSTATEAPGSVPDFAK